MFHLHIESGDSRFFSRGVVVHYTLNNNCGSVDRNGL